MNPCEHWEELLSARLDGPLTQEEARQLEDHLAACPRCRQYARELEETHKALQYWGTQPPPAVAEAILDAVRKDPRSAKRPRRAWKALAAAAVLALVIWGAVQLPGLGETAESASTASDGAVMEQDPMEDIGDSQKTNEEYSQESASAEPEASASPLSQDQAEGLLKDFLDREGRDLTLSPRGFSENGKAWLFAARDSQGQAALFSVALDTGEIREIPAGTPEN